MKGVDRDLRHSVKCNIDVKGVYRDLRHGVKCNIDVKGVDRDLRQSGECQGETVLMKWRCDCHIKRCEVAM